MGLLAIIALLIVCISKIEIKEANHYYQSIAIVPFATTFQRNKIDYLINEQKKLLRKISIIHS